MIRFDGRKIAEMLVCAIAISGVHTIPVLAQYGGGGGTMSGGSGAATYNLQNNYHVGFDRPEAWGLKYFASTTLLSGLQPPAPAEGYHAGSVTVGFEAGWLPALEAGQRRIGFLGTAPEDLNKAPMFGRLVVRIGLPHKLTAVAAAPPPFQVFGITSHLLAFGLERPLVERERWTLSWRGYGQVGSVKGAFTCPKSVLASAPGTPQNSTDCVGESAGVASLRYAGSEFQFAYHIQGMRKLTPHASVGGNFIDGVFHVHAPVEAGLDQTRLWTRGGTFSTTGGITYSVTKQAAFTVDAFSIRRCGSSEAPLRRDPTMGCSTFALSSVTRFADSSRLDQSGQVSRGKGHAGLWPEIAML